ncbi:MAG TPA: hypothetical protein VJT49_03470 [Amycolatopsis sp.]|nr:hypothetical protein [Amycolatopsis sp.]HKS44175.1 hypothetical protein [Amycolatopsis sp.]
MVWTIDADGGRCRAEPTACMQMLALHDHADRRWESQRRSVWESAWWDR